MERISGDQRAVFKIRFYREGIPGKGKTGIKTRWGLKLEEIRRGREAVALMGVFVELSRPS